MTTSGRAEPLAAASQRRRITVSGVVQGVGFRPFVWRLARAHHLRGLVRNTGTGVLIEVEGRPGAIDEFRLALVAEAPPLARIASVDQAPCPLVGAAGFHIDASTDPGPECQSVAPDAATCSDCVHELFDPTDRRFRYPFLNCTNCGPRFTIIEDVPYDRRRTTMRGFAMCSACAGEYGDPSDRRFHAQPTACPRCGPRLWATDRRGGELPGDPVTLAVAALQHGEIVALKSLGGFQLACSADNSAGVERLRNRKHRPRKPFAVMVRDLATARALCAVCGLEAELLTGSVRPIVLMRRLLEPTDIVAAGVAHGLDTLGLMLPYTPLHHLLVAAHPGPLVMTSGNVSDEPIARDNDEAVARLGGVADMFLLHDRPIYARYDDSVVRVVDGEPRVLRRARGYCPAPVEVAGLQGDGLAFGAHLKNTFAVAKPGRVYLGPHIGDLDDPLVIAYQRETLATYLRLFRAAPRLVACDSHPDYGSTRLAEEWVDAHPDITTRGHDTPVRVQHHHAHIASVMAEQGLRGSLIGVAFDGTGWGPDATVWGGEFLLCDESSYRRVGHLVPVSLPGGDRCSREGWRMAAAYLVAAGLPVDPPPGLLEAGVGGADLERWRAVGRLAAGGRVTRTTSVGRLFDAVASLLGVAHHSTFEAEAAMRLEVLATGVAGGVTSSVTMDILAGDVLQLDAPRMVRHLVEERRGGRPVAELAAGFHEALSQAVVAICERVRDEHHLARVALSGGAFQNALLLTRTSQLLRSRGFEVFSNCCVPANDGGISLGQALVMAAQSGHLARVVGRP